MYLLDKMENSRQKLALIEALFCQVQDVIEINQEACRGLVIALSDVREVLDGAENRIRNAMEVRAVPHARIQGAGG
jgi:hypothetical protein